MTSKMKFRDFFLINEDDYDIRVWISSPGDHARILTIRGKRISLVNDSKLPLGLSELEWMLKKVTKSDEETEKIVTNAFLTANRKDEDRFLNDLERKCINTDRIDMIDLGI